MFGRTRITSVDPHDARSLQADGALVVDVREPHEYASGHIPDAHPVPLGELSQRTSELPRDRQLVLVCASGARSGVATQHLAGQGIDAVNLDGGMMAWQQAGLPVRGVAA